jgi:NADPH:quinone reductase-like Zn-dependent oxidoreductase
MKAIRLHAPGGVDNLVYEDVNSPALLAGEAVVRVHAAAITRDELGWPVQRLPAIPSYELSGTVVAIAEGVVAVEVGQAVYALTGFERDGVAAEFVAVPVERLASKPATLSHVESAAVPLPALSAMQGLFDHGHLEKGQRVLIHGGGGGVGAYAVQLAHLHGAYVIATATGLRVEVTRTLGADEVIDHTAADFSAIEPVDLVFDTVGGDRLLRSASVLGPSGRLVSVAEAPSDALCADHGIDCTFFIVEPNRNQLDGLARLADQGQLRVLVDSTYSIAEAREAFRRSLDRSCVGKVVLRVVDD